MKLNALNMVSSASSSCETRPGGRKVRTSINLIRLDLNYRGSASIRVKGRTTAHGNTIQSVRGKQESMDSASSGLDCIHAYAIV